MRSLRIAFVLLTTFVFFIFLNNVAGELFPASKAVSTSTTDPTSQCEDKYKAYTQASSQVSIDGSYSSVDSSNQTYKEYNDCIKASEQKTSDAMRVNQEAAIKDQARNVYVAFGAMIIILAVALAIKNRLPLLTASMFLGGLMFIIYFPTSNVVASWYSSISSTSEAVGHSLDNAILITSIIGFISLALASFFGIEKKTTLL